MAEAILNTVLGNLADAIVNEAHLLGGVRDKVEQVQRELSRSKCCLEDADSKCQGDARVQNWLNELRDVAYRIEDATDTFFLQVEDDRQKNLRGVQQPPGCSTTNVSVFLKKLKKFWMRSLEVPILHKLGNELDAILTLLEEISKSRLTYGIRDLPVEDKSKGEAVKMPLRRATYSEVDETQVVGMQADKDNILKLLHCEQTIRMAVITIVGAGGLGKTTLACMVHKSAKADFDYHIMLSISQKFSLTDLLRKMISKFDKSVLKDQDVDYYADKLNRFLYSNRYLIILDDVWTVDMWNELKEILPDVKNGSRVLMTTRFLDVAKLADSKMSPCKLKFLDERESLDLLLKKAFPYQKPNEECPLLELALKLSNKCKGLPLALIVLGSILATKELSYPAWERVLQTMDWHSDGSDCMQILAMSYKDMPLYLKECFRYLASFPEDYEISAQCVIRMWAAEGFLEKGRRTIEMMAEECLEQLAERSMVQVLRRSVNGLIKHFKVHDILRELAMREANDANSVMVFSRASYDENPNRIIRRASLQAQEKNSQFMDYIVPKTRSLIVFDNGYGEMSLQCSNFRLLRVLEFVGTPSSQIIRLKSFGELNNLKYLGIRECSNIDLSYGTFHGLKRLETLDVRGSHNFGPCDGLWTISTLKHVLAENYGVFFRNRSLILGGGILMSNIETLKWVRVTRACDANLPNLRKLGIQDIESDQWDSITNLLPTLPVLVSLGIHAPLNTLPMEIVYPKALPQYQNLQTLFLRGKWPENVKVEASLLPPHLLKLTLKESNLSHDPIQELAKLKSLKKLHMGYCVLPDDWQNPTICGEGFPSLQYLKLSWRCNIKDLTVAAGVMSDLKFMKVKSNTKVQLPCELQHVTVQIWYLKYLTKKYMKKHNVCDWLRVISSNKDRSMYKLQYFNITENEGEEED